MCLFFSFVYLFVCLFVCIADSFICDDDLDNPVPEAFSKNLRPTKISWRLCITSQNLLPANTANHTQRGTTINYNTPPPPLSKRCAGRWDGASEQVDFLNRCFATVFLRARRRSGSLRTEVALASHVVGPIKSTFMDKSSSVSKARSPVGRHLASLAKEALGKALPRREEAKQPQPKGVGR